MKKYIIENKHGFEVFLDENFPPNFLRTTIVNDYGIIIDYSKKSLKKIDFELKDILYFFITHYNLEIRLTEKKSIYYLSNLI